MSDLKNLQKVKTALAEKYENLAKIAGSEAKKKRFVGRAVKYRRQAAQAGHGLK